MIKANRNYLNLVDSYLFTEIDRKSKEYLKANPEKRLYKLGIGDVTLPLCEEVINAMHKAVDDQANKETFRGYMFECGETFLTVPIKEYYEKRGCSFSTDEIFVSSGAGDDLADILDLFDRSNTVLVMEPAYPAYVDTNTMDGRKIIHLSSGKENGFLPLPDSRCEGADIIYICSPNNPTGAVFSKEGLKKWVDFALQNGSVILFDAAYEIFIEDDDLPHSIYEVEGADRCAIEISSLSKTAGFTGTRLGYTVVPKALVLDGINMNALWSRNRVTKTNGVSYILQKGGAAVFTEKGQKQIKENIAYYKRNAKVLTEVFDKLGIWYTGGKNAPYIWIKCPNDMSGWDMFDYLLNEIQVVATPGDGFGECGKGYFRFSTFGSNEDTKVAAERIYNLLSK